MNRDRFPTPAFDAELSALLRAHVEHVTPMGDPMTEIALRGSLRQRRRRTLAMAGSAIAVAAVVALVAGPRLLEDSPANDQPLRPGPSATAPAAGPDQSQPASTSPSESPSDYKLLDDEAEEAPLEPGKYALTANGGSGVPLAVIDAPRGFTNFGGWTFLAREGHFRGMGYWTISSVDRDPCDRSAGQIDPGTSVDELADALAAQKVTTTTKPVPVTVGGHEGVYLELTVPTAIDFSTCTAGRFNVWSGRYMQEPGQVERLWILDTEHGRLVLATSVVPGATEGQIQELTDMVESVRFVNPK